MAKTIYKNYLKKAFGEKVSNVSRVIETTFITEVQNKEIEANIFSNKKQYIAEIYKGNKTYKGTFDIQSQKFSFSENLPSAEDCKYAYIAYYIIILEHKQQFLPLDLSILEDNSKTEAWARYSEPQNVSDFVLVRSYGSHKPELKINSTEDFTKLDPEEFKIRSTDSYDEVETERMEQNTLVEGFVPVKEDVMHLKRLVASIKQKGEAPSFFYYGPAGTGKSETGKYFSMMTGIPYTFVTCSAMTNEGDLRGKPSKLSQNGSMVKLVKRVLKNFYNRDIKTDDIDSDEIEYNQTELVLACQKGWIIEVQEAAHIIDAGTLGFLNCTLDSNRVLTLPNGKQIKIHPNTTFIFTTNVSYEGCNPFNLSLLSRMTYTRRFDKIPQSEQIKRVQSVTGCDDIMAVTKVVQAVEEVSNLIVDNDISQGICDLRSAIDCINDYMLMGCSLRESAKQTIEDKACIEPGYEEAISLKLDSILCF